MSRDDESHRKRYEAARLTELRRALGYKKRPAFLRDLYKKTDVTEELRPYEKWEDGVNRIPDWFVDMLRETFGVSYDFIRAGDERLLPLDVANKLAEYRRSAS